MNGLARLRAAAVIWLLTMGCVASAQTLSAPPPQQSRYSPNAAAATILRDLETRRIRLPAEEDEFIASVISHFRSSVWTESLRAQFGERNDVIGRLSLQLALTLDDQMAGAPAIMASFGGITDEEAVEIQRLDDLKRERIVKALGDAIGLINPQRFPRDFAQANYLRAYGLMNWTEKPVPANIELAIPRYRAAIGYYERAQDIDFLSSTYHGLGRAFSLRILGEPTSNFDQAISYLRKAVDLRLQLGDSARHGESAVTLADVLLRHPNTGQRAAHYAEAEKYWNAALSDFTVQRRPFDRLKLQSTRGQFFAKHGRWREATSAFDDAMQISDLMLGAGANRRNALAFLQETRGLYETAAVARFRQGDLAGAVRTIDRGKGRLLAIYSGTSDLSLSQAEKQELRATLDRIRAGETGSSSVPMMMLPSLRQRVSELVSRGTGELGLVPLATGYTLAIPVYSRIGFVVFVVHPDGRLSATERRANDPIAPIKAIADLVNNWNAARDAGRIGPGIGELQRASSAGIGGAIASALDAAQVPRGSRVILLTDGYTGALPLGLLAAGVSGETLLSRYALSTAPSIRMVAEARTRAAAPLASTVMQSVPPPDLTYAEWEHAVVAGRFARTMTIRTAADLGAAPTGGVWHFATHAAFKLGAPGETGLVLSDGRWLTLAEIEAASATLSPPRLVVLSACQTGRNDFSAAPSEFLGLPTAFLRIGAVGVVASAWEVDDASTSLLIDRFMEELVTRRRAPAEALREAQLWLSNASRAELLAQVERSARYAGPAAVAQGELTKALNALPAERPFANPYFWGAFSLSGL